LCATTDKSRCKAYGRAARHHIEQLALLVDRIDLTPGSMNVRLDSKQIAKAFDLDLNTDCIDDGVLTIDAPFERRKRGVETKLLLGHSDPEIDLALVRNVATARSLYQSLRRDTSFADLAIQNQMTVPQIHRMLQLAYLSPKVVSAICTGQQRTELTARQLRDIDVPLSWDEQEKLFELT
jgi:hypothetical protein